MKLFRQKQYTIQEGHYTGPKDVDKVPGAIEIIGKSALAGSGIGAAVGGLMKDSTMLSGAFKGGKIGAIVGTVFKFLLNYLHNPMNTVKYQNVDKSIRREFGIYSMSGVTVGDSLDKRATLEEKFSFNDRDVTNYKLNFCIQDNKITMYTFGMTDQELTLTSKTLDYYCKKYFGMEYTSNLLNRKVNAYAVNIVFTNYQVIANFIMELSKVLNTKINLLDNKALVDIRIPKQEDKDTEEKTFSFGGISKYDLIKIIGKGGVSGIGSFFKKKGSIGASISSSVIGMLMETLNTLSRGELAKIPGISRKASDFQNDFLKETLKRLHYVENIHYTVGDITSKVNMSLISGIFIVSVPKKSEENKDIEKNYYKKFMSKVNYIDSGDVSVYSYVMKDTKEFELLLKSFMALGLKPNVFEK